LDLDAGLRGGVFGEEVFAEPVSDAEAGIRNVRVHDAPTKIGHSLRARLLTELFRFASIGLNRYITTIPSLPYIR